MISAIKNRMSTNKKKKLFFRLIHFLLNQPGILAALSAGFILGTIITTVFALVDNSHLANYIHDHLIALAIILLLLTVAIIFYFVAKEPILHKTTGTGKSSLSDIAEGLHSLFLRYVSPSQHEKLDPEETREQLKVIANYIASTVVLSSLYKNIILVFGTVLSAAGTFLLLQQIDVMKAQRLQDKQSQLLYYIQLPETLSKSLTGPQVNRKSYDFKYDKHRYVSLSFVNENQLSKLMPNSTLEGMAHQLKDEEMKSMMLPILKGLAEYKESKIKIHATQVLDYLGSPIHTGPSTTEVHSNLWIELHGEFESPYCPKNTHPKHFKESVLFIEQFKNCETLPFYRISNSIGVYELRILLENPAKRGKFEPLQYRLQAEHSIVILRNNWGIETNSIDVHHGGNITCNSKDLVCKMQIVNSLILGLRKSELSNSLVVFASLSDEWSSIFEEVLMRRIQNEQDKNAGINAYGTNPLTSNVFLLEGKVIMSEQIRQKIGLKEGEISDLCIKLTRALTCDFDGWTQ